LRLIADTLEEEIKCLNEAVLDPDGRRLRDPFNQTERSESKVFKD
jgi:hypothetical protein